MVLYINKYHIKSGTGKQMEEDLRKSGCVEAMEAQPGNLFFRVSFSATEDDVVFLTDGWEDEASFQAHLSCEALPLWHAVKDAYILDKEVLGYNAEAR